MNISKNTEIIQEKDMRSSYSYEREGDYLRQ